MSQLGGHVSGWFKDKVGKRCNKARFVRRLDDVGLRFLVMKELYFGDGAKFLRYDSDKSAEVSLASCCVTKKNVNEAFVDWDSGAVINFSGVRKMGLRPEQLDEELSAKDVKVVTSSGTVADRNTLLLVGAFAFLLGGVVVFMFHSTIMGVLAGL